MGHTSRFHLWVDDEVSVTSGWDSIVYEKLCHILTAGAVTESNILGRASAQRTVASNAAPHLASV